MMQLSHDPPRFWAIYQVRGGSHSFCLNKDNHISEGAVKNAPVSLIFIGIITQFIHVARWHLGMLAIPIGNDILYICCVSWEEMEVAQENQGQHAHTSIRDRSPLDGVKKAVMAP